MLTKEDYKWAYYADSAVNLSGLAHSLAEVCRKIRAQVELEGRMASSQEVNEHAIVKHYVQAMYYLSGAYDTFEMDKAREEIKQKSECYPFVFQD